MWLKQARISEIIHTLSGRCVLLLLIRKAPSCFQWIQLGEPARSSSNLHSGTGSRDQLIMRTPSDGLTFFCLWTARGKIKMGHQCLSILSLKRCYTFSTDMRCREKQRAAQCQSTSSVGGHCLSARAALKHCFTARILERRGFGQSRWRPNATQDVLPGREQQVGEKSRFVDKQTTRKRGRNGRNCHT